MPNTASPHDNGHHPTAAHATRAPAPLAAPVEEEMLADLQGTVARQLTRLLPPEQLLELTPDDQAQVWAAVTQAVTAAERDRVMAGEPPLGATVRLQLCQRIYDDLLRLGPVQRHLADPTVEDVILNGHTRGFVAKAGGVKHEILTGFTSEEDLYAWAARTVAAAGRRLDAAHPAVDIGLPDGSRLHVIAPPLAAATHVTIRRPGWAVKSLEDLVRLGTLTPGVAELLAAAVRGRLNIVISGGTATGKTTLLHALCALIPPDERIITIEQTRELRLEHPDWVALEARDPNVEGEGEVSQRYLFRQTLRMRPTRVILGEARGGEALDMLTAMHSGHDGSMGTLHASDARQALIRLHALVGMAEAGLSSHAALQMIAHAVDLLAHLTIQPDGRRVLVEVAEVAGVDDEQVLINQLVAPDDTGRPAPTGLRPTQATRLHAGGWGQGPGHG